MASKKNRKTKKRRKSPKELEKDSDALISKASRGQWKRLLGDAKKRGDTKNTGDRTVIIATGHRDGEEKTVRFGREKTCTMSVIYKYADVTVMPGRECCIRFKPHAPGLTALSLSFEANGLWITTSGDDDASDHDLRVERMAFDAVRVVGVKK